MKLLICLFAFVATAMPERSVLLEGINDQFTTKMFQEVLKSNPDQNIILSAFSVLRPLAQLALASEGATRNEILQVTEFPQNNNETIKVFSELKKQLQAIKTIELHLANRLYVNKDHELNEQFAAVSKSAFDSDVKNVDFGQKKEAASEINKWVKDNTNNRIKDLISPDSLDHLTVAVLANVIYFKGKWLSPFNRAETKEQDFFMHEDKTTIPMMNQTGYFLYGESEKLEAQLLELPYKGFEASLLLVLPNNKDGINSLIEKLNDPTALSKAAKNMESNSVVIAISKFKIKTTTDLRAVFQKMNIKKLFTPGEAELKNLVKGQENVYITSAVQKAYIGIDEAGTEAAAADGVVAGVTSTMFKQSPKNFIANHPFYFALKIADRITFSGIYRGK